MIDPLVIPIVAIVGANCTISIGVVAHYVYLLNRLKSENALKQDMLLRGYSADEIAQVVGARGRWWSSCAQRRLVGQDMGKDAKKAA